jgi:hypothetical protein
MQKFILGAAAATSLLGASVGVGAAQAAPSAQFIPGVYRSGDVVSLTQAQFLYAGRNFCWYTNGWEGPGYYWCGYAWRRGLGWGGGAGWNGWGGGGHRGGRTGGGSARAGAPVGDYRNANAGFAGVSHGGSRGGAGIGVGHSSIGHSSAGRSGGGHIGGGRSGGGSKHG